ncbi:MAG TPA: hypothetical protein VHH36_03675 [Candidatus Thermoplasmatota archaeon]|nr:hypothetical protein [Candidatus Thermoplasmatota archaeon]
MPAPKRPARKTSRAKSEPQPEFPIVYVKYHDHCWLEAKELKKIQVAKPFVVEETGFLLAEAEKFITLAKERSTDGEKGKVQYDDVTIIMRSDVLDLRTFPPPGLTPPASDRARRG